MKKTINLITFLLIITLVIPAFSQDVKTLPKVTVKDLKGVPVEVSTFSNDGKPFIIDFWATWCVPCIRELANINKVYEKWQTETGVKLIAISIDDSRTSKKIPQFVKGRNWKYEFYNDENSDLKRAMGVNSPPHTFIVNVKGEIVWEHSGYADGSEEHVIEKVKELLKTDNKVEETK